MNLLQKYLQTVKTLLPASERGATICGLALALCAWGATAAGLTEHGRLHHIHLNVSDIAPTSAFYEKVFGVVPVTYNGRAPALMAERTFLFLNQVAPPIPSSNQTGLIHIGWGGIDGPAEFAFWKSQGIEFFTPLTAFMGGHFMYLLAPDRQVVELWTPPKNHRLNHLHLLAADPEATAKWFAKVTNSAQPATGPDGLRAWHVNYGDITLDVLPDIKLLQPRDREGPLQPTDGAGIDHIAFSFQDLGAAYRRVKADGTPIVRPLATVPVYGVRSFFVHAPNGVLVEMVKANPLPEAVWR